MKKLAINTLAFAIIALIVVVGLIGSLTAPANAATSTKSQTRLATIKSASSTAIENRTSFLDTLSSDLKDSRTIAPVHRSALLAELATAKSGLSSLDGKIQDDTTTATAMADSKKIVADYRVYVLQGPKVREIMAIDALSSVAAKMTDITPKLEASITAKSKKGADVASAQAALADLKAKTQAINTTITPLADPLLSLQPSGYPDNRATIQSTRTSLGNAASDAKAARDDINTIIASLK